jgi:hypothetical protein
MIQRRKEPGGFVGAEQFQQQLFDIRILDVSHSGSLRNFDGR